MTSRLVLSSHAPLIADKLDSDLPGQEADEATKIGLAKRDMEVPGDRSRSRGFAGDDRLTCCSSLKNRAR